VVTGHELKLTAVIWLQVNVEGVNWIIAAIIIDSDPGYSILLRRHWMASVGMRGNYKQGTYMIKGANRGLREVTKT
jgi:hypothetical protein